MRKRWNWLKRASLSAALLVLLAEGGLRLSGLGAPAPYIPDPDLGWAPRERPVLLAKPAGAWRVALLGDEAARPLLARLAASCGEVVDFSVPGYGTAQHYVQLQSLVMRYEPDLVLLAFNPQNDVRNNSFVLEPRKERPFFFIEGEGRLAIDASFATAREFRAQRALRAQVLGRSRLWQLATRAAEPAPLAGDAAAWQDAWRVTSALLDASAALVRRHGARFALVLPAAHEPLAALAAAHGIPLVIAGESARLPCMGRPGHGERFEAAASAS